METLKKRSLFWDTSELNPQKNQKFIIERILNFGDEDDFHWALKTYGEDGVRENLMQSKVLDKKSLFFWCQYFNLNQNKCLKKQSVEKRGWFWKR
jgi:hypothetical protein